MKRPFTLLELLVSLSLSAILIGFLMTIFFQATKTPSSNLWPLIESYSCRQRLNQVLSEILTPPNLEEGALIFTFNNGIDDDPHFCGEVGGKLSTDEHHRLILALFPAPTRWKGEFNPRVEILLGDASNLHFHFYEIPLPDRPGEWKRLWEQQDLPALVKIEYTMKEDTVTLTYPVVAAEKPPRYYKNARSALNS